MAQTDPAAYLPDSPPPDPDRTDRVNFAAQMYAFFVWMAKQTAGGLYYALVNLPVNVYNNAVDCYQNAVAALAYATQAANSAASAGATKWISGTTYAIGDVRWSPINGQSYRRLTAGAGTT